MLPASLAFAWLLWRQHSRWLLVIMVFLFAVGAASAVLPTYCSPDVAKGVVGLGLSFTLPLTGLYLIILFTYGAEQGDVTARESCFPPHLLRLPVATSSLVVWPLVGGAAAAALLWLVIAWFILRPWLALFDDAPALVWPAFLSAAMLAWLQALLWSPFGLRELRLILLVAALAGLILLASGAHSGLSEPWLAGLFASLTLAAWAVAYNGVIHARRGDVPNWEALLAPLRRFARRLPRWRTPFVSAARAQTWFEWRLTGLALPIMTGLVLPFALFPLHFGKNDVMPTAQTLLGALAFPVFLAGMAGGWPGGGHNRWVRERAGIMPFLATLPAPNAFLVGAMLKAAAYSVLTAWALVAVFVLLAVVLTGNQQEVMAWWRQGLQDQGPGKFVGGLVAVSAWLLIWTWKRKVDSLYLGLTGRLWLQAVIFVPGIPLSVGVWVMAAWIYNRPATHEAALAVLPWLLGLLISVRLLAAVWLLRLVLRQDLLKWPTVARWLAAWVLLAAALFGMLVWTVPAELLPRYYLGLGVLIAMPMARLAGTPLALAYNRHR